MRSPNQGKFKSEVRTFNNTNTTRQKHGNAKQLVEHGTSQRVERTIKENTVRKDIKVDNKTLEH